MILLNEMPPLSLIRTGTIGLLLFLLSDVVMSANWYQVEMIVFEHQEINTGGEFLYRNAPLNYRNTMPLVSDPNGPKAFRKLSKSRYKLGGVSKFLAQSGHYRLLHHLAWQQPELARKNAREVRIIDDKSYKFEGSVKVRGGYLLHLDVDIAYFFDSQAHNSPLAVGQRSYTRIQEARRIKLNELHYFDHPAFGVIVRVIRLAVE